MLHALYEKRQKLGDEAEEITKFGMGLTPVHWDPIYLKEHPIHKGIHTPPPLVPGLTCLDLAH